MQINTLKDKIKGLPQSAGVYIFSKSRQKLYIGKALNLRSRVKNYLDNQDHRLQKMIATATNLTHQETVNDIEALILESQLIKKWRPIFNIVLRDDKNYFYVEFTDDQFPRIYLTHQPSTFFDSKKVLGPFTDGSALKTTLRELRKIFPYCTCPQKHYNFCLNYHIGKCLGFCCLSPRSDLESSNRPVLVSRSGLDKVYSKNIKAIKGILSGKKNSVLKNMEKEMIKLGKTHQFPEAIILRQKIEKIKRVFENVKTINYLETKERNESMEGLKKIVGLDKLPLRIEGYDISNISGKHATGVMVVFTNGEPNKKEYRRFKISASGGGDTAMLKEVLSRRFNHPEWPFPDLIIIDGGKAQLNVARKVVSSIPTVSLTKNVHHQGDHIFMTNKKDSVSISKLDPTVKNLILAIDTEAHRFAINYYRTLHRRPLKG